MRFCIVIVLLLDLLVFTGVAQEDQKATFIFYNVENLFDLEDDSLTADDEFTPEGDKRWTSTRYYDKIDRIARTLSAAGEYEMPALIGLCEVENRKVINDLIDHRYFKTTDYGVLHRDSPDERGIDVAFIYNTGIYKPIATDWIRISFPFDPEGNTREILYTSGLLFGADTLHIFINHWPSRWGGVEATKPYRAEVAKTLRLHVDSLLTIYNEPYVLIAGDFNDNPTDVSLKEILGAYPITSGVRPNLVNLMFDDYQKANYGSLKYKADWEVYDQIIVSGPLLKSSGLYIEEGDAHIFDAPFLITEDERYLGTKPFRTYAGPRYLDGYSDHLPVYIKLVK